MHMGWRHMDQALCLQEVGESLQSLLHCSKKNHQRLGISKKDNSLLNQNRTQLCVQFIFWGQQNKANESFKDNAPTMLSPRVGEKGWGHVYPWELDIFKEVRVKFPHPWAPSECHIPAPRVTYFWLSFLLNSFK